MPLVNCDEARHAEAILDILNEAILHSTAVYDYQPRPPEAMRAWFAAKRANDWPVLGLEDDAGVLLGFASYGSFRAWPAYKYTVEHSIYVHRLHRGRGHAGTLLTALVDAARQRQMHTMIGGIDADNAASLALHRRHGFEACGLVRHAGYKFGRWLDLAFMQRILDTPAQPSEA
jgi:L-amino acid N-acyltransferase